MAVTISHKMTRGLAKWNTIGMPKIHLNLHFVQYYCLIYPLLFRCSDKQARSVHQMAVTGMFVAAAIKELRQAVLPTMVALVRHYTMVAIAQQAGPFPMNAKQNKLTGMDPLVLIDAMAVIMGHEEKELCKPGHLAMVLILDTATNILGKFGSQGV